MIVICGDTHIQKKQPFLKASTNFFNWLIKQNFNKEANTFIHLGDLFDKNEPDPLSNRILVEFLHKVKFKKIFFLAGNHDYQNRNKCFSGIPFNEFSNVEYITDIQLRDIENKNCLFIPHMYLSAKQKIEGESYKEKIEKFLIANSCRLPLDCLFHHLELNTIGFNGEYDILKEDLPEADLTIGGHIHIADSDYLGTPYPTRADEKGQTGKLLFIQGDNREYKDVPRFLDYSVVVYGEEPVLNPEGKTLLNIVDAPTDIEARRKYKDFFINTVEVLPSMLAQDTLSDGELENNKIDILELFDDCAKEKKLDSDIKKILRPRLEKIV